MKTRVYAPSSRNKFMAGAWRRLVESKSERAVVYGVCSLAYASLGKDQIRFRKVTRPDGSC